MPGVGASRPLSQPKPPGQVRVDPEERPDGAGRRHDQGHAEPQQDQYDKTPYPVDSVYPGLGSTGHQEPIERAVVFNFPDEFVQKERSSPIRISSPPKRSSSCSRSPRRTYRTRAPAAEPSSNKPETKSRTMVARVQRPHELRRISPGSGTPWRHGKRVGPCHPVCSESLTTQEADRFQRDRIRRR